MKYFYIIPLSILLLACNDSKNEAQSQKNDYKFILGLINPINTSPKEAGKGLEYNPDFAEAIIQPDYLKYLVDDGIQFVNAIYTIDSEEVISFLPINFEYNFDEELLNGKEKDNDFIVGQYDFNKDGKNEIVFILKDNNKTELGLQIDIIEYLTPPDTAKIFCEYWKEVKKIDVKDVAKNISIRLKKNKLVLSDGQVFNIYNKN